MSDLDATAQALLRQVDEGTADLVRWRRDLHRYPETAWMEFRTSGLIARSLTGLGFEVSLGRGILDPEARMGVPPSAVIDAAARRALDEGAPADLPLAAKPFGLLAWDLATGPL